MLGGDGIAPRSAPVLNLLRQRNLSLLWIGGLTSSAGSMMLSIALPFYIYARTHSALATGAMFVAQMVPAIVLGSIAGVFVDRWDRRRIMIAADVARAVLLLLLLAVDTRDRLWIIYIVADAESVLSQFFSPASGALLPRLVGARALMAANSLGAFSGNLTLFVAPSLGGALLGLFGLPSVVLADSASYLVSGILIASIRMPPDVNASIDDQPCRNAAAIWLRVWHEWRDGLRVVRHNRVLTALFLVVATSALAQGIFSVLIVLFVKDVLLGSAIVLGWLATAQGIGGLGGGLIAARFGMTVAPGRLIGVTLLIVGMLGLAMWNVPLLLVTLAGFVLSGAMIVMLGVSRQTLLQSRADDLYRGRVLAAAGTTGAMLTLLGTAVASGLGDRLGAIGLDVAGGCWILAGVLALVILPGDDAC